MGRNTNRQHWDGTAITYQDMPGDKQLNFANRDTLLVTAMQEWFDAQVSNHGNEKGR